MQRLVISPTQLQNGVINLNVEQNHYLKNVLRLGKSDRFVVMDGLGHSWLAELSDHRLASIIEPVVVGTELPGTVTLMVASAKGNAFDEIVRCCTELGVTTLMPVMSDRTLLKPSLNKLQRWRRIAQEAAEQSERELVPIILSPLPFSTALTQIEPETSAYICVTRKENPHLLHYLEAKPNNIIIATGPEGGWTETEVEAAICAGFQPVSLGSRILRAVTAPIFALSLVTATWENKE